VDQVVIQNVEMAQHIGKLTQQLDVFLQQQSKGKPVFIAGGDEAS
jgi:hypothetical protein